MTGPADDEQALLSQLTVCYSSLRERVGDVIPPHDPNIEVVVLVQGDGALPDVPDDVRVVRLESRGVARSRNAALDVATRRYLLFCDDDVVVNVDGVLEGIRRLRSTGASIALGRGVTPDGALRKQYSDDGTPLTLYNSGKAATYELLIDIEHVRARGIRFDVRFGAGADNYLGDEYIFIADALRAGLRGVAVGHVFGIHPDLSSGSHWGTDADRVARALVVNRVFGRRAVFARAAFAGRHLRELGPLAAVRFVLDNSRVAGPSPTPPHTATRTADEDPRAPDTA